MNDLEKILNDNSIAHISSIDIVVLTFISCFVGWLILKTMKNKYDGLKMMKRYGIYIIPHLFIAILLFKMQVLISISTYVIGGVFMFIKSNRYFYE